MKRPATDFQQAAEQLKAARRVAVLTGAGISAESGLPTFRNSEEGLWAKYRPQDLATPQAYAADPELVWEWYAARYRAAEEASPSEAHYLLAELERRKKGGFFLATQNVDGLHLKAGSGAAGGQYAELHGNLRTGRDEVTGGSYPLPAPGQLTLPPYSPEGHRLRPGVVWFGEPLPQAALQAAANAFAEADFALIIGTSGAVQPAAGLGELAASAGAVTAEINPNPSQVRGMTYVLRAGASEGLRALLEGWE